MTTSESPIDIAELTRLANELFQAVPGQEVPATAIEGTSPVTPTGGELFDPSDMGGLTDLPLSLVGAFGAPTDTTSAPAWLGGVERSAAPGPVSSPSPGSEAVATSTTSPGVVPTSGVVLEPTTVPADNPAPSPTADQLSAVPVTLTEVMGFVAGVPQVLIGPEPEAPQDETPVEPPAQVGGSPLPDSGRPVISTPPSLGIFEFHPEMLPSLTGTSATARPFDPYAIRRDFPILSERVNGRPLIWLDNGATTQKPQVVIDRLSYFYEHENSNIHRGAHALAARATDAYEDARNKVRRFINAASTSEIVFVRGATEAINLVAKSWGVAHVGAGDEVLVTHLEHHANIVPWQQLCQQVGATLKVAPVDGAGQIILSEFERLIKPRTKMVAMTQVSNALGTVTPVGEMVAIARRHGATTLVDAAQSVLHMRVDVQALDADFLVFSGHKVFAPTGIGVVYGKSDVWAVTPPWQGGGNMIADVTFEQTVYQPPPNRFEAGTGNIADAVGLGAALDYVAAQGIDNITAYERELLEHGTAGLMSIKGLHLIGTAPSKAAVLSFVIDGYTTEAIGQALDRDGIAVRAGHHCAQPILRRFGVESTVRASLAMYNTREDVDCLVESLRRLTAGQPRI